MEPHFEFTYDGRRFTVETEVQPERGLHNLHYRGHFLRSEVTSLDATKAEITSRFTSWLADHPVSPYECRGGPLDGELIDDQGPLFVPADVSIGQYRLRGEDYEWEQ